MKTLKELEALPDDELRPLLAGMLGWLEIRAIPATSPLGMPTGNTTFVGFDGESMLSADWKSEIPNYPADLNACQSVTDGLCHTGEVLPFLTLLSQVCQYEKWDDRIATARQRTIALILTLQKP